ncbi:MAG TPA: T9SS type A sorting domain-containing protein, partial [Cytophagaceae bacterium]|nr:T9SS type A sorting domain-containing protein [Cytophagaceae bacterium]
IVMGAPLPIPLTVIRVGGNTNIDANCNPIVGGGTLIVGGVGGTGPYKYSMTSATGPWQTTTTFSGLSVGSYPVWVQDATTLVKSATLQVLGPLQINGNNADITFCNVQPVTLTATNAQNPNATYSWSPGGQNTASITVTPAATTLYTVTSTVPFTGANLLANGGFEGGNPAGFVAGYTLYAGGAYATTPGNGALYKISTAATNLCTNFTNPGAAEEGSNYFIGDGGTSPGEIFHLNLTGLTPTTTYSFSYWYMRGSVSAPFTPIQTSLGATVLGTVVASNTTWAQASYTITTDGTGAATVTLTNTSPTTSTNGNDFLIDNLQVQLLKTCTVTASMSVIINCTPAPVELISFNAVRQGAGALVTWTTASEKNSSYYIIEKSTDGINFYPAGKVDAKGNSNSMLNYSFVDPSISTGITYYRLVEYDINGASQYSAIKSVSKEGSSSVQVIPNPNNGIFVIATYDNNKSRVIILNSLGQMVYSNESTENLRNVDISALASGVYYLQVSTSTDAVTQKIVKE